MIRQRAAVVLAVALAGCSQPVDGIEMLRGEARAAAVTSDGPEDHRRRIAEIRARAAAAGHDPDMIAPKPAMP